MLNPQISYDIEIANYGYGEFVKNPQIIPEQLEELITKKRFEDELIYHIEQYNQNDDYLNDQLRNNQTQLEADCHRKSDETRALSAVSVAEYYQSKCHILKKEFCNQKLHLIEEYQKKTRQTASKYEHLHSEKFKYFQLQLVEQQEKIQSALEKLEQLAEITIVGHNGRSSAPNINVNQTNRSSLPSTDES